MICKLNFTAISWGQPIETSYASEAKPLFSYNMVQPFPLFNNLFCHLFDEVILAKKYSYTATCQAVARCQIQSTLNNDPAIKEIASKHDLQHF